MAFYSFFSKFLLRQGVVRVFVSLCVLVFVRANYLRCLQHVFFVHLFNLYKLIPMSNVLFNVFPNMIFTDTCTIVNNDS